MDGKVVVVTGASQGIGWAISERFAEEGARIVAVARTESRLQSLVEIIQGDGGEALAVPTDVTDEKQVQSMVDQTLEHFGAVDGLVNSAGISPLSPITETSLAIWQETMDVNVTGTFLCCRAVWSTMRERGGGSILNISSGAGKRAHGDWVAYCASKWAVMGLTESLAMEGFSHGILVNALCPGPAATPMRRENFPDEDQSRILTPEEVAEAALLFFSKGAKYIRNAALDVRKAPRGWTWK